MTARFVSETPELKMVIDWDQVGLAAATSAASASAAEAAGRAILARAQQKVPYKTGRLHDTGDVTVIKAQSVTTALISYDTPYAVRLHEHPEYNFHNGREGRWLANALREAGHEAMAAMVSHFRLSRS